MTFIKQRIRDLNTDAIISAKQVLKSGNPYMDKYCPMGEGKYFGLAGNPKSGKTALMIDNWICGIYLNNPRLKIRWDLWSLELPLVSVAARIASNLAWRLKKYYISHPKMLGLEEKKCSEEQLRIIDDIIDKHVTQLLGVWENQRICLKDGDIRFMTKCTPHLFEMRQDELAETAKDYDITISLLDHTLHISGGESKDVIDKVSKLAIKYRNGYGFSYAFISQMNRAISNIERSRMSKSSSVSFLRPTLDDIKETGAIGEDADLIMSIFNPCVYSHITNHFGYDILTLGEYYRYFHVVVNRIGRAPNEGSPSFFNGGNCTMSPLSEDPVQAVSDVQRMKAYFNKF